MNRQGSKTDASTEIADESTCGTENGVSRGRNTPQGGRHPITSLAGEMVGESVAGGMVGESVAGGMVGESVAGGMVGARENDGGAAGQSEYDPGRSISSEGGRRRSDGLNAPFDGHGRTEDSDRPSASSTGATRPSESAFDREALTSNQRAAARAFAAAKRERLADRTRGDVDRIASRGTRDPGRRLPYLRRIQRSFGRYDVSSIDAHRGPSARASAGALNAAAYAMGSTVVFGRDPDLWTAAHEAAHVIQQQYGLVSGGGRFGEADRYERHADAVARAVVRGEKAEPLIDALVGVESGGSAVAGPSATEAPQRPGTGAGRSRRAPQPPSSSNALIQRKIGFEFQAKHLTVMRIVDRRYRQILKEHYPDIVDSAALDRQVTQRYGHLTGEELDHAYRHISKGEVLSDNPKAMADLTLVADTNAMEGLPEIEAVTEPFPETEAGLAAFHRLMDGFEQIFNSMQQHSGDPELLSVFTDDPGAGDVVVADFPNQIKFGPQMTAGIDLSSIRELVEIGDSQYHLRNRPGVTKHHAYFPWRLFEGCLQNRPKTLGLIMLLRLYIFRAAGLANLNSDLDQFGKPTFWGYLKKIGDVLLSRTDFATAFELIEPSEKRRYRENPDQWVADVLGTDVSNQSTATVAKRPLYYSRDPPIPKQDFPAIHQLTIGSWLREMIGSVDPSSGTERHGWDRIRSISEPARMSLSDMVGKWEPVGPTSQAGPIIEYRHEQGKRLTIDSVREWGDSHFKAILGLNGNQQYLSDARALRERK